MPENYLPFTHLDNNIVNLTNGNKLIVDYSLEENFEVFEKTQHRYEHWLGILDLTRLNLETRTVLASLLLLPLGVLITATFRHFIGIHSYGVFTPTLLALAITHNQWQTTLVTLAVIIFFSTLGRRVFPRKLSRTPRLSIIFTLVAISMAMGVSVIDYYIPSPEGYAVLLPIVILTSLIDRFFLTLDDKGQRVAYIRLFWTFVITITCLPVLLLQPLGHFLVKFPEIHLITLAAILFITHYRGRKLSRFVPALLKEPVKSKKESEDSE